MNKFKLSFIIFLIFLLFLVNFFDKNVSANTFPLLGKVIYIDPGHGGRDPGVIYGNIYEKDINLEISKKLEEELSLMGATVFLTREEDIDHSSVYDARKKRGDLYRRIKMIDENSIDVDIYLSIHINWYNDGYWSGGEVLYYDSNSKNKILAEEIMKGLINDTNTSRSVRTTNLYMYKYIKTPGVLIECGFLSNYKERNLLQTNEYQTTLAKSITKSVINYFKNI